MTAAAIMPRPMANPYSVNVSGPTSNVLNDGLGIERTQPELRNDLDDGADRDRVGDEAHGFVRDTNAAR